MRFCLVAGINNFNKKRKNLFPGNFLSIGCVFSGIIVNEAAQRLKI
jgi:hypothetical protein